MTILRIKVLLTRLNSWLHREAVIYSPRGSRKRARAIARWAGAIARKVDARNKLEDKRAWIRFREIRAEQARSEEV